MQILFNKYPATKTQKRLWASLFAIAGVSLCAALLFSVNTSNKLKQQRDIYGKDIAQLVSIQLPSLMAGNNHIALQALLNQVVDNQYAVNATLYDVDSNVIVYAGKKAPNTKEYLTHTNAISLDEALIGSLTLTTNSRKSDTAWLIFSICLPLILLAITSIYYFTRGIGHAQASTNTSSNSPDITSHPAKQTAKEASCLLAFTFCDINKLYQQLNAQRRQQQFERLNECLEKISTLYAGKRLAITDNAVLIKLSNDSSQNNILNALCCAHLLLAIRQQEQWLIGLSAHVYRNNHDTSIVDYLLSLRELKEQTSIQPALFIENNLIHDDLLNSVTLSEIATPSPLSFKQVIEFKGNRTSLLKNQLNQILNKPS